MTPNFVDIVICAHNEGANLNDVIKVAKDADLGQVIIVLDACTDGSIYRVGPNELVVEINARNKGTAMAEGFKYVTAPRVMFCDADLWGLTPETLVALADANPVNGMVSGITEGGLNRWSLNGLPPITGERILPTEIARKIPMAGQGYKVELVIDAYIGDHHIPHASYLMDGVYNPSRVALDPRGWVKMWPTLGATGVRNFRGLARYARES
jgi:glycosyltransferase involved in cell wall biosynthesis